MASLDPFAPSEDAYHFQESLANANANTRHHDKLCSIRLENVFGPIVESSCLNGFDFTLLFEELILTLLPLAIALTFAVFKIHSLRKEKPKVKRSWLFWAKMATYSIYIAMQTILLSMWLQSDYKTTSATVVTASVTILGSALFLCLSALEHTRSIRPSALLALYMSMSLLLDLFRFRTILYALGQTIPAKIFLAGVVVKFVLTCLETIEKRSILLPQYKATSSTSASGIFNNALYFWLNDLLYRGYSSRLTVEDLTPLDNDVLEASRATSLIAKWKQAKKSSRNALLWVFLRHYKWGILGSVVPRLATSAFVLVEPYFLEQVLIFTTGSGFDNARNIAYGLTAAYALLHIGKSVSNAFAWYISNRTSTMFRGSLVTLVFDKTLRLNMDAEHETDAITLMSADVDRILDSVHAIHDIYTALIEFPLSLWLLARLLGWPVAFPTIYALIVSLVAIPVAGAAGDSQEPWLEAIEERLAVTSKALNSMKAIKMTGLTGTVSSVIAFLRVSELRAVRWHRILIMCDLSLYYASFFLTPNIGLAAYAIIIKAKDGTLLTDSVAFAALSLWSIQAQPLDSMVTCVKDIRTLATSFRRIQTFVTSEERTDPRDCSEPNNLVQTMDPETVVSIQGASAGYSDSSSVLNDINVDIVRNNVTMVVGPVGSGKSSFLKLLLGEMPESSGIVKTNFETAAFCPQLPWITWGSIRSNILGMTNWDKLWYSSVVDACALGADFDDLPQGDQTPTGTRGSRLSGGQQMRVSLARAVYSRNPVLFLDDVLTGLDRKTERTVLEKVFGTDGLLKKAERTVVLATNSAKHLHYADHIIVLNKEGTVAEHGSRESIIATSEYVKRLAGESPKSENQVVTEPVKDALEEYGIRDEDLEDDSSRLDGDGSAYLFYMRAAGLNLFIVYLVTCLLCVISFRSPSLLVQQWTNYNLAHPDNDHLVFWVTVVLSVGLSAILTCCISDWMSLLVLVPKASLRFHEYLLKTTMGAKLSFLTSTAAGHTTNRFSQDLEQIDSELPDALESFIIQLLNAIVSATFICAGSGYVAIAIPFCIGILYSIQRYYLRTSRQLRFLDIETKAPLFSQFLEVNGGVSSIRAYGWTQEYLERSYDVLNASQKPFYLLMSVQRWLELILNLMVGTLAVALVSIVTSVPGASTSFLGVALFSVIDFSWMLKEVVTEWTKMETAIGAITRIRSYIDTTQPEEQDGEKKQPASEDWPSNGTIEFRGVSAAYETSLGPVLKDVNLTIRPGEKVAICGRTGSGKSSFISALLCMLETTQGSIVVDGVDISTLCRDDVRKHFNTLPQESFFMHGSVRDNIDPLCVASDKDIIEALQSVNLWEIIEARGGLAEEITASSLSRGEQQLFCLARSIVRPSKVVIMDEATSSVDSDTDEVMQKAIRDSFNGSTLIAIVHKLDTVLDFDRVVLLDQGSVIENGNPKQLLASKDSSFKKLYDSMS